MNTTTSYDPVASGNFLFGDNDLIDSVRPVSRKLLVVDDDPSIRPVITAMIKRINPNSEIDWATSAEEALHRIQSVNLPFRKGKAYDVVLTDVYLGEGQSGIELAENCFEKRISSNLVLMTGLLDIESKLPIIKKPFRFESVKKLLAPYLDVTPYKQTSPDTRPLDIHRIRDRSLGWFSLVASFSALALCLHTFSTYKQPSISRSTDLKPRDSYKQESTSDSRSSDTSLVKAFANPELQRAIQKLLKGGVTPLLKNPAYWKGMEADSRTKVEALFRGGSSL